MNTAKEILSIVLLATLLMVEATISGCGNSDSDSKPNASDVAACKATSDAMDSCFGMAEFGTTLPDAKADCDNGDFDDYDHCFFSCEENNEDCDDLADCFDNC
jgi:hypothetical protein